MITRCCFPAKLIAGLALCAATLAAAPALASGLPTGNWTCHAGPSWDQFKTGAAPAPVPVRERGTLSHLWIFDATHYASMSQSDRGRYELKGDQIAPLSGPFTRVPMTARYAARGVDGRPTVFLHWATAPALFLDCQPGS